MRVRFFAAGAFVSVLAIALWLVAREPAADAPSGQSVRQDRASRSAGNSLVAAAREAVVESLRALPRAAGVPAAVPAVLRDTDADGALPFDRDGRLTVTRDVRRFFDHFLIASGDERPASIRQRIVEAMRPRLPSEAVGAAIAVLDRYLAYRERVRELAAAGELSDDLGERLDRLRAVRREVLGERDAEAFFGTEEAEVFVALAQRDTTDDPSLSAAARKQRAEALEAQLPADARAAHDAATAPLRLAREEQALRAAGEDETAVRAVRERYFGADAADRLQTLDEQHAAWQRRLDAYREVRAIIDADPSLSEEARLHAIEALGQERFTSSEQIRVRALDRIAASTAR